MGLKGGALIANPVPATFLLPKVEMDELINLALQQANHEEVKGKKLTHSC